MEPIRAGSFWNTLFYCFAYGYAAVGIVAGRYLEITSYQHDIWADFVLGPLGALAGFIVATFVHELAHFFTALAVGGCVRKIMIGSGQILFTFSIRGTSCEVHESLRSGAVFYYLTSTLNGRRNMALITAAAPVTSLILTIASVSVLWQLYPLADQSMPVTHGMFAFVAGFSLPCIAFLPGILLPYKYQYAGRTIETDALRLLSLHKLSDDKIAELVRAGQEFCRLDPYIDPKTTSLQEALRQVELSPDDPRAVYTAVTYLRAVDDPLTIKFYERLEKLAIPLPSRLKFLDEYVTYCLEKGFVAKMSSRMDQLSQELVDMNPADASVQGTRGAVLIDLGRIDEGKSLLQEVLSKSKSPLDKGYSHVFLALAAKRIGEDKLAISHANQAAALQPPCNALARISDLLEAPNVTAVE